MKKTSAFLFCVICGILFLSFWDFREVLASSGLQTEQECAFISGEMGIPRDSSWLSICIVDRDAPIGTTITDTNLKIWINHPHPERLEIQLLRIDAKKILILSPAGLTKDGMLVFTHLQDFNGIPSQGKWILRVRDTSLGTKGSIKSVSLTALYSPVGIIPESLTEQDGTPTSVRLVDGAFQKILSFQEDQGKGNSSFLEISTNAVNRIPIMTQTFEGTFPPTNYWTIYDTNPDDGKEYYWDDDDLKAYNGTWSVWPANGGIDGIEPTLSTTYPTNMDTWMIYGPFDLSNAKSAYISFMLWREIEPSYDHIFFGVSANGSNFNGWSWDGNADWENKSFSLSSYLGDNEVWIGWHFTSDGTIQKKRAMD